MKLISLFVILVLGCFNAFAQVAQTTQTISGHGNVAIAGDNNEVNNSYNSKIVDEDLITGRHNNIFFEDKAKTHRSGNKRLLLLTATNFETMIIQEQAQKAGLKVEKEIVNDQVVYNLGTLAGVDIIQMQPAMMGMLEPGSTPLILMSVFNDIKPDYIIATGIAFGRQSKGQELGDILISRQLVNYESRKESNGDIYFRGDKVTSPMLGRINAAIHSWKGQKIHQGLVLSGNALVNSKEFLKLLASREPEYVGGDMEAYGVYAVASMMGKQWVMIKGISDWGDGSKNDDFHHTALENTGNFIFYVIKQGCLK